MKDIEVEELKERLDKEEQFVFLDVREVYEYEEDNLGAKNIPLAQLPNKLSEIEMHKDDTRKFVRSAQRARCQTALAKANQRGWRIWSW